MGVNYRIERLVSKDACAVQGYFIASTAPKNVEDPPSTGAGDLSPDAAVREIAAHLAGAADPELVLMVHGFSTSEEESRDLYAQAFATIGAECDRGGTIFVGFRWPAEKIGEPLRSFFTAEPLILFGFAGLMLAAISFGLLLFTRSHTLSIFLYLLAFLFGSLPVNALLLRGFSYFRDCYRILAYGAPDLLQLIRHLDRALSPADASGVPRYRGAKRVGLSFIGHSLGALLVTSLVRILTDVFEPTGINDSLDSGTSARSATGEVGNAFTLARLVLTGADIPADSLITQRTNFLAPALVRFEEAYLFCNGGDAVLRFLSTLVNSFFFPTRRRRYGYRLGNTEILSREYGFIPPAEEFIAGLRVGDRTLHELSANRGDNPAPSTVAERFTYFDCTDYVDTDPKTGRIRGYLTRALRKPKLNDAHQLILLLFWQLRGLNLHGGYYDGDFTRRLIFRLACLGWNGMLQEGGFADEAAFGAACGRRGSGGHQIRVLRAGKRA